MKKAYIQLSVGLLLNICSTYGMENTEKKQITDLTQKSTFEVMRAQLEDNRPNVWAWKTENDAVPAITPSSFNFMGKTVLLLSIQKMQDAASQYNIKTGLAKIFNNVEATVPGIDALISDPNALKWANEYYTSLQSTTYPTLKNTFPEIANGQYPGALELALDIKRTMIQVLAYKQIYNTSNIRMPEQNIGMMFMGTTPLINAEILKYNENISVLENEPQARGTMLLGAYCIQ